MTGTHAKTERELRDSEIESLHAKVDELGGERDKAREDVKSLTEVASLAAAAATAFVEIADREVKSLTEAAAAGIVTRAKLADDLASRVKALGNLQARYNEKCDEVKRLALDLAASNVLILQAGMFMRKHGLVCEFQAYRKSTLGVKIGPRVEANESDT